MSDTEQPFRNPHLAVLAAQQATEASTELLRFYREGPASDLAFGDIEVIEKLAEALVIAITLHLDYLPEMSSLLEAAEAAQLRDACNGFISGWAG